MKASLCLAIISASIHLGPAALAQAGSTNGSGSGFLNTDIIVSRGGFPGPAQFNPFLEGVDWRYRILPSYYGYYAPNTLVQGRLLGLGAGSWRSYSAMSTPYGLESPCASPCSFGSWGTGVVRY